MRQKMDLDQIFYHLGLVYFFEIEDFFCSIRRKLTEEAATLEVPCRLKIIVALFCSEEKSS